MEGRELKGLFVGPTDYHDKQSETGRTRHKGTVLRKGLGLRLVPFLAEDPDDELNTIAQVKWVVTHLGTGLVVCRLVDAQVGTALTIFEKLGDVTAWDDYVLLEMLGLEERLNEIEKQVKAIVAEHTAPLTVPA